MEGGRDGWMEESGTCIADRKWHKDRLTTLSNYSYHLNLGFWFTLFFYAFEKD